MATRQGLTVREMVEADGAAPSSAHRTLHAAAEADARSRGKAREPELLEDLAGQAVLGVSCPPLLRPTHTELWRRGRLTLGAFAHLGGSLTDGCHV